MKTCLRCGLLLVVLFAMPVQLCAQDDDEEPILNTAWLNVVVDRNGAAKLSLQLRVQVSDPELLKRALAESLSFPVQLTQTSETSWTVISGESQNALSRSGLKSTCRINLQPLLPLLRSQNVERLQVWIFFPNASREIPIEGPWEFNVLGHTRGASYQSDIDLHAPAIHVVDFRMGYTAVDILKKTIPLVAFLCLPLLWTRRSLRKFGDRPEELWGRHLRFINRLLNVIWLVWLPVYSLSGLDTVISFVGGADYADIAQLVNLTFYFVPPILAMLLCHTASRKVYELVPAIQFSPSDVVRHSITVTAFSLAPLFLLMLGITTFRTNPRQAVLYAVIGYVAWLILSHAIYKAIDPDSYALSPGDLRDRIFELANKAGVLLKQVYVLPEDRAQLSNAFARSDDCVGVTNSVLKHLSRREVDAVMAHEIAHLQKRHPHTRRTITLVIIIVANVAGTAFAWMIDLQQTTAVVFSGALALSSLVLFFVSRRNEREADAIGVTLTGDPESSISGLAKLSRLSLEPMHSGVWGESLDTHPGTMRRFQTIAQSHGISSERVQELVADSNTLPDDRYPAIETEEGEPWVFSGEFKKKYRMRTALVLIGAIVLAPVPFAVMFDATTGVLRLLISVAGFVCSFGVYQLVRNKIVFWGQGSHARQLRAKLERRGHEDLAKSGTIVGLAPASESRKYDGYQFWDAGVLWLTNDKLYYIGELTEFVLERAQVENVYTEDANPEWFPEKNLFLEWQKDSEKQTLHFVAVGERSVWQARRAIDSLKKRLDSWRQQTAEFSSTPAGLESIVGPAFPEIASGPIITSFKAVAIFVAAFQFAFYGLLVGVAVRLSFWGIGYVAGVVFVGTMLDELPKAFRKRAVVVDPVQPANYQPGSWADANATGPEPCAPVGSVTEVNANPCSDDKSI